MSDDVAYMHGVTGRVALGKGNHEEAAIPRYVFVAPEYFFNRGGSWGHSALGRPLQ